MVEMLGFMQDKLSKEELMDLNLGYIVVPREEPEEQEVEEDYISPDMFVEDIDVITKEDYSTWVSGCELGDELSKDLSLVAKEELKGDIEDSLLENIYFLAISEGKSFNIFSRSTKYGELFDLVDEDGNCAKRFHYVRLDIVTNLLFEKYSGSIKELSKLIANRMYHSDDNFNRFVVGSEFYV